jgi:hypothetical protein
VGVEGVEGGVELKREGLVHKEGGWGWREFVWEGGFVGGYGFEFEGEVWLGEMSRLKGHVIFVNWILGRFFFGWEGRDVSLSPLANFPDNFIGTSKRLDQRFQNPRHFYPHHLPSKWGRYPPVQSD